MSKFYREFLIMFMALALIINVMPVNVFAKESFYTEIISPQYEDAKGFSEGLSAVKKNGKWGYIDEDGNVVIDFQYLYANPFSEDKAVVVIEKKEIGGRDGNTEVIKLAWGFIDRKGKFTPFISDYWGGPMELSLDWYDLLLEDGYLKNKWETTKVFYNGVVILSIHDNPARNAFDHTGKEVFLDEGPIHAPTEGVIATHWIETQYLDLKGKVLFADKQFAQVRPFNQGLAPVGFYDKNGELYFTIMDRKGNVWKDLKFYNFFINDIEKSYKLFNDNSLASISNFKGKWGAINKEGDLVIPYKYDQLYPFNEGVAAFLKNGKFGYIDIHGNEVIKPKFDNVTPISNGIAVVTEGNNAYIMDRQGNKLKGSENLNLDAYIVKDDNGEITMLYSPHEYLIIKEKNKYGFAKLEYQAQHIDVTAVSLNRTTLELEQGEEERLVATIAPIDATNKYVTWSSSNEAVATVDQYGKVKAHSTGKTTITVTTKDGKYTATSEVTVREPSPYANYRTWSNQLEHDSVHHSWTVTFSENIDAKTVNDASVYIIDQNYNKVDLINLKVENSKNSGSIILGNNGSFKKNENYWIIVEGTVQSIDGKKLGKGMKVQFKIK